MTIRLKENYASDLLLSDGRRWLRAKLEEERKMKLHEAILNYYREEGYEDPQQLEESIKRIYPALTPDDFVTVVKFQVIP